MMYGPNKQYRKERYEKLFKYISDKNQQNAVLGRSLVIDRG